MRASGLKARFAFAGAGVRAMGPGSVSSFLKIALDVAYVLLWILTGILLIGFAAALFVPLDNLSFTVEDTARPLTRTLILFGLSVAGAYFASFVLILRNLRKIFRTLTVGDPFEPRNVARLRQIGLILATVTAAVYLGQAWVSRRLPEVVEPQSFGELLTPIFSVLVVFVLAEVFREGARLRRESELTI